MKKYKLGLIIAMLIWGSIGIFVRYIDFTSSQIALVRAIVGNIKRTFIKGKNKIELISTCSLWNMSRF